jgi:hypothetical protein
MAVSLEVVAFTLTTILLAAVATAAIVGADTLLAHGRLTRCPSCHRYFIATGHDDHVCHRPVFHSGWHMIRQPRHSRALLGDGHTPRS